MLDRVTHRAEAAAFEQARMPAEITRPALGARPIETSGWDVVSAVRIGEINEAIENAGTSPDRFEQDAGDGVTVRGNFLPWRIGPDGEGALIDLDIGLRQVEIERGGEITLIPDALAIVRVFLELLPTGKNGLFGADPTQEFALVLKTSVDADRLMADKEASAATVMEVDVPGEVSRRDLVYLKLAMKRWMNDNLDQFHHVFATVNLVKMTAEEAEGKAFSWMMPSEVGYAFARSNTSPENSVLAILCQTGGRSAKGLLLQAQADIIPTGANGAFAISKQRFVREMMLPGVAAAFKGLKTSDFDFRSNDGGLKLKKPVKIEQIEAEDGKKYDPTLHKFDIVVRDTEVAIESVTKVPIAHGVRSVCLATAHYTLGLSKNSKGQKTLGYKNLEEPTADHETEKDPIADITDIIRRIGLILGGILMTMSGPVGWIALACAVTCLAGEFKAHYVDKYRRDDSPPMDLMVANATTAVSWSTGTRFEPIFAALNGGLQVGGVLGAAKTESLIEMQRAFQAPHRPMMMTRGVAKPTGGAS